MVLVPGDRVIEWAKLRQACGVRGCHWLQRKKHVVATGYEPGTITPFGSITALPVIADASMNGLASIGGAHGVAINVDAEELIGYLRARVADVEANVV